MPLSLTAAADDNGRRLDRILRKALRTLPLSAIHRLLRQGCVCVDGKTAQASRRVLSGETITVTDAAIDTLLPREGELPHQCAEKPEILFEGAGLLILNKAAGVAVHGEGNSLERQVCAYLMPKLPPSLSFKPGPLHRIDQPSSGLVAFSASLEGARFFSGLIRERRVKKFYLTLACGKIEKNETWQDDLSRDRNLQKTFTSSPEGGKEAVTRITPLAHNDFCTLLLAEIETGRTHQIRAQAAAHGHPLLADRKYEGRSLPKNGALLLHAWRLEFPADTPLPRVIEAPLPAGFSSTIRRLFGEKPFLTLTNYASMI